MNRSSNTRRPFAQVAIAALLVFTVACISTSSKQKSKVLEYLYPEGKAASTKNNARCTI